MPLGALASLIALNINTNVIPSRYNPDPDVTFLSFSFQAINTPYNKNILFQLTRLEEDLHEGVEYLGGSNTILVHLLEEEVGEIKAVCLEGWRIEGGEVG